MHWMKMSRRVLGMLLVVSTLSTSWPARSTAAAAPSATAVFHYSGSINAVLDTDGRTAVVQTYQDANTPPHGLVVLDVVSGAQRPLVPPAEIGVPILGSISGGRLIVSSSSASGGVFVYEIATDAWQRIGDTWQAGYVIDGDIVAWKEAANGRSRIFSRHVYRPEERTLLAEMGKVEYPFTLRDGRLTWAVVDAMERDQYRNWTGHGAIFTKRLGDREPSLVCDFRGTGAPCEVIAAANDSVLIFYWDNLSVRLYDAVTKKQTPVYGNGGIYPYEIKREKFLPRGMVRFDGRNLFAKQPLVPGNPRSSHELIWTDVRVPATARAWDGLDELISLLAVAGGTLLWFTEPVSAPGQESTLWVQPVAQALPTGRRTAAAGPTGRYFPETGHTLSQGFKVYWEQHGGLPVFGYPLTEEFTQVGEPRRGESGYLETTHTVQYFERQIFEYHPENRDTVYEVLLARLGAHEAEARGLLQDWAFQPVNPAAPAPSGCRHVAETQHRLCNEFAQYFEAHGLELGDRGTTWRESVALFGYPISEEFVDPATGLVTQYFERARFEYHPNLPRGQRVLLGRLAADRVASYGW